MQQKHNPDYKLVSKTVNGIEYVYGISNSGTNEGLEVYYGNYSRRFLKIPIKYQSLFQELKGYSNKVNPGHNLNLTA